MLEIYTQVWLLIVVVSLGNLLWVSLLVGALGVYTGWTQSSLQTLTVLWFCPALWCAGQMHQAFFALRRWCQKSSTLVLKYAVWKNDSSLHSCDLRPVSADPGIAVRYPHHPLYCNHHLHHKQSGSILLKAV